MLHYLLIILIDKEQFASDLLQFIVVRICFDLNNTKFSLVIQYSE